MNLIVLSALAAMSVSSADPFTYRDTNPGWCQIPLSTERVEDGRDGDIDLYLFTSGNFAVAYEEHTPSCAGVPGECRYDVPVRFFVEGRWSASGDTIQIGSFGRARIVGDALEIKVDDGRASPSARAHTFTARSRGTTAVAYTLARQMEYYGYKSTIPEVRDAVYR